MKQNVFIDLTKMSRRKVSRNGVCRPVGEIEWTDEETKNYFTDSDGRVHSVVFVDPDTGERCFG